MAGPEAGTHRDGIATRASRLGNDRASPTDGRLLGDRHQLLPTDSPTTAVSRATFEVYQDRGGEWRWRLVHDNGNIIADSGEGYASPQKCEQGIDSVKANAAAAPVERLED